MSYTKESAIDSAKTDLAERLKISVGDVNEDSVADHDFPDMALGATIHGEMAAQMISSGWRIGLKAKGKDYEYRADKYQLRLYNFNGANYVIGS